MRHPMVRALYAAVLLALAASGGAVVRGGEAPLVGQSVLVVVAPRNFQDQEYARTRSHLEAAGATVVVASRSQGGCTGMAGLAVEAEHALHNVENPAETYAALVLIGGSGTPVYYDNPLLRRLAQEMVAAERVVGAICLAPVVLARAGLLQGRHATCWKGAQEQVSRAGAEVVEEEPVVVDGRLVTANGPAAADAFGKALVEVLVGLDE